jgi:protein TonB
MMAHSAPGLLRSPAAPNAVGAALLLLTLIGCAEEPPQTPPQQLAAASPFHYPEELWDADVEGETTLRLFVNPDGAVDSVRIEKPSGYAAFDSSAVRGARSLRFTPARRGEEPIGSWVLLPVRFDMPRGDSAAAATPTPPAP